MSTAQRRITASASHGGPIRQPRLPALMPGDVVYFDPAAPLDLSARRQTPLT
jgi:hypothetical protein